MELAVIPPLACRSRFDPNWTEASGLTLTFEWNSPLVYSRPYWTCRPPAVVCSEFTKDKCPLLDRSDLGSSGLRKIRKLSSKSPTRSV